MIYIAWVLSLILAFGLGYFFSSLTGKIEQLEVQLQQKADKPEEIEKPSELIDPYDEVQTALYEQKKMMDRLNAR